MITISKQPYECSFTKNPVVFEVQTNMQFMTERVFPRLIISVNNIPSAGEFIKFQFINPETNDVEVIRLAVNTTDTFPGALPSVWSGTTAEYATEVVSRLKKMHPINAFYTFYSIGKSVFLDANDPDQRLVFSELDTNQSTLHLEMSNFPLWNDPDPREGYTMRAIVYFEKNYLSGNFEPVADCTLVPDENNHALLDISDILDSETESGWDELPMPGTAIQQMDCLRRYYVEFIEYWDDDPVSKRTKSDVFFSHWGGVSTDDELMIEPLAYIQANGQWLTWWPSGKKLYDEQMDWLSWMNTGQSGTFTIRMIVYKNTGPAEFTIGTKTLNRWESITIPVGQKQRQIIDQFLDPGESFIKWGFQIKNGATVLTPTMLYYRQPNQCINHQILYWNSFGGPETFRTNGEWKQSSEINRLMAKRALQFNNYRLKPGIFVFDSKHQNSIETETGRITKMEGERLQAMFNSTMCMVWTDRWIPAIVTTDKTPVLIESEFTTELKVEILMANVNEKPSFYKLSPMLVPVFDCGIVGFKVKSNDILIEDYGQLDIYFNGFVIQNADWNGEMYVCATTINSTGTYDALTTIYDIDGNSYPMTISVPFQRKRIIANYTQTGGVGFYLTSSEESSSVRVDWGNGLGFETRSYFDTATFIGKTVSVTGNKQLILEKACFDDIVAIQCEDMYLSDFEFHHLINLETLSLDSAGLSGIVYLNALTKIKNISISSMNINGIEIGIIPLLVSITISNCPLFGTAAIDHLVVQIWEMRNHFQNAITVSFSGTGLAWSIDTQARIDGTGIYAGQGLSTDYGFTLNIS